ncbi:MAG: hypothetical protein AAFX07_14190, partial [Pseudomonadota bacterium]
PLTRGVLHWLELGQFAEVLGGGCEGELVLNAAWTAQSEPSQANGARRGLKGDQGFHIRDKSKR